MMFGFYILLRVFGILVWFVGLGGIIWGFLFYFFILIVVGYIWKFIILVYILFMIVGIVFVY